MPAPAQDLSLMNHNVFALVCCRAPEMEVREGFPRRLHILMTSAVSENFLQ